MKPDPWNIAPAPENAQWMQWNPVDQPEQPVLLDLDNPRVNSSDLQSQLNDMNIPELGQFDLKNLSLTDIDLSAHGPNMTDSLTKIVNEAATKNLGG